MSGVNNHQRRYNGKIEGLLVLYAINLVVLPIYLVYDLISLRAPKTNLQQNTQQVLHRILLLGQAIDAILIVLLLVLAYSFFTYKRVTRTLAILSSLLMCVASIVFTVLVKNFIKKYAGDDSSVSPAYLTSGTLLWLFYWVFSKRVKATFTRQKLPSVVKTESSGQTIQSKSMSTEKSKAYVVFIPTICATIVLILAIAAWTYSQHQSVLQKDRALKQQEQNLKYEQNELNQRQQNELTCKYGNPYQKLVSGC